MYYLFIVQGARFGPISFLETLSSIGLILGLYSFTFKKYILEERVWRYILWALLALLLFQIAKALNEGSIYTGFGLQELLLGLLGGLLLAGPSYYAVYKRAYPKGFKASSNPKKKR